MAVLSHGSDLSLAPTLGPLVRAHRLNIRQAIDALTASGFHYVHLDISLPGVRPRDLDQRARKDLTALMLRSDVVLGGVELFIPGQHFLETGQVDRAMAATLAGIELAADLGRLPLSIALPVTQLPDELKNALVQSADGHSIRLSVHAEDQVEALGVWAKQVDLPALGMGLDPAALLAQGADPVTLVHRYGKHLASARLSDAKVTRSGGGGSSAGGSGGSGGSGGGLVERCILGDGELDVMTYRIAIDLAAGRTGPVVLELRGLADPLAAARTALRRWNAAAPGA